MTSDNMKDLTLLKDVYIKGNLNVTGQLIIKGKLRVLKFSDFDRMTIQNACFIEENLYMNKNINWYRSPLYSLITVKANNNNLNIDNNLNI